jgi:hypothetical protein
MKGKVTFNPVSITETSDLESLVKHNIEHKEVSYYLFVNDWDTLPKYYLKRLEELENLGNNTDLYVINIFNIPNALNIIKGAIKEFRETISTNSIQNYSSLPMLLRLHGAFPVAVTYSGSILSELGLL